MKLSKSLLPFVFLSVPFLSQAQAQSSRIPLFEQDWALGGQDELVLRFSPCDAQVCGTIVALGEAGEGAPGTLDTMNPNAALRSRRVCGLQVLTGLTKSKKGWSRGTAYSPGDGVTIGVSLTEDRGRYFVRITGIPFVGALPLVPAPANPIRRCQS